MRKSSPALGRMLCALLLLLGGAAGAVAQPIAPGGTPARGEELSVYVMTMGPGPAVYERFGHNAIWIRDPVNGTDLAYNYGMFSFEQDNFLLRFIRGHMDYWMEGFDAELTAASYVAADRSVWAQELNLTPEQRADLRDFLEWNARPENRVYRYDYYYDNCSTRVRDAIDLALGGQLRAATEGVPSGTTFRDHTRALTVADPLLYTGLMAGLGQPVDREISVWEEMFLPLELRERIADMTIIGPDGSPVPLVLQEFEIYRSTRVDGGPIPSSREGVYLLFGLLVAAGVWMTGVRSRESRRARAGFGVLAGGWSLLAGLLGVILVGLWAFTDHATSYRNENILHLSPLLLLQVGLLHRAVRGSERATRAAWYVAAAVAGLSALGFVLQVLPWFSQANGEIIALALPINVALAAAVWRLAHPAPRAIEAPAPPARSVGRATARA